VWNWGKGAHWAQGERDSRFSRKCLKRDIERERELSGEGSEF